MNLTRGINLRKIAELMPGASGAEVKVIGGPREKEGAEAGSSGFKAQQPPVFLSLLRVCARKLACMPYGNGESMSPRRTSRWR